MNSLNSAAVTGCHRTFLPGAHHRRLSCSRPIPSITFRTPPPPLPVLYYAPIRASSSSASQGHSDKHPKFVRIPINAQSFLIPFLSPLKTTLITSIAAAALLFSRFYPLKPAIASPVSPPAASETATKNVASEEDKERAIEEHLISEPNDVRALRNLMELKIKSRKLPEAIEVIEKLIVLEPEEKEWPLLKAHLYAHMGELAMAKDGFNKILKEDLFRVEAYHGLVTTASQEDSSEELRDIEKRVEEAMKLCKKENKKSDLRDFKLLLAQIRVIEGRYDEALKVYQELVKEEPRDFRPYLCQGIIYTLLRKNEEAEKNFEKYRRLVPKGHPYASYFDDNMIATKLFAQKVENERAAGKS